MAESGSGQEKTEEPTAKKIKDAREEGQVARSRELNTLVMLLVSGFGFLSLGEYMISGLLDSLYRFLSLDRGDIFSEGRLMQYLWEAINDVMVYFVPLAALLVVAAIASSIALSGWAFSTKALVPKLNRMDPIKGLKRIFAWRGMVELLKSLAKFVIVSSVGYLLLINMLDNFLGLGAKDLGVALTELGRDLVWIFILLSSTLIVVALLDVPFQLWDYKRQLKMTRQEVKDENKESEGNPELKGKQRSIQREAAIKRMMDALPQADVVVTNPTHFAVALKYDQDSMVAPRVVAKGADLVAQRIKQVAGQHEIPVLETPMLARALYYSTDLNREIPAGLYLAVAQVLAYVYQLQQFRKFGGDEPVLNTDLPIPDDLRKD